MSRNIKTRFNNIENPNGLIPFIEKASDKLQERHPQVLGVMVTVDKANGRPSKGLPVRAKVSVLLPGKSVHVKKEYGGLTESANASFAVYQAFEAARSAVCAFLLRRNRFLREPTRECA